MPRYSQICRPCFELETKQQMSSVRCQLHAGVSLIFNSTPNPAVIYVCVKTVAGSCHPCKLKWENLSLNCQKSENKKKQVEMFQRRIPLLDRLSGLRHGTSCGFDEVS